MIATVVARVFLLNLGVVLVVENELGCRIFKIASVGTSRETQKSLLP
jgi:hypothetical protein